MADFVTVEYAERWRREQEEEFRELAAGIAGLGRLCGETQETLRPIRRLVDGDGRAPLGERIALIERVVNDIDGRVRAIESGMVSREQRLAELELRERDRRRLMGWALSAAISAWAGLLALGLPKLLEMLR